MLKFDRRRGLTWESRRIDKMALWGKGADISGEIHAGVDVNQSTALTYTTFYACLRLVTETLASLPADVFRRQGQERVLVEPPPAWLRMPNPDTTWFEFVERIVGCLLLDGNAFLLVTARDRFGWPVELWTLNPRAIVVEQSGRGVRFIWDGDQANPLSKFSTANPAGDVLHIKALNDGGPRGLSPVALGAQAIGLGLVTEKFGARFFGTGAHLGGVIEMPPTEPSKTAEYVRITKENWQKDHGGSDRSHLPGVLVGGAKWEKTSVSPEEAQFLETRKFQVHEIAKLFGVPPYKLGLLEPGTVSFASVEQQAIDYVQTTVTPRLVRLEHAFNQLVPRGQFIKWNVNGLLRGDMAARAEFYSKMTSAGIMLRSEPRQLEDLPEVSGLDRPVLPAGVQILAPDGSVDTPVPPQAPPMDDPNMDAENEDATDA